MATTTNYGWDTPDDTDLVKDGASAIRTLGSSIDTTTKNLNPETTTGDIAYRSATANVNTRLAIGSAGQVLTVAAGVPSWATPSDQTPLTTKGDVFTFSTVDARLGVGANGTVLTADSTETTGLKWATPASGGKVLQVVSAQTSSSTSISTTSYADTSITATITPTLNTSKILVMIMASYNTQASTSTSAFVDAQLLRDATMVVDFNGTDGRFVGDSIGGATSVQRFGLQPVIAMDSPASTSALTYKLQAKLSSTANSAAATFQFSAATSSIILMEIGA